MRMPLLQGTLDMLVLKALTWGPLHGYGIARWLEERTRDGLSIEEGSLYPALARIRKRGWVEAEWAVSDTGRRARFYQLTTAGRAQLERELSNWIGFSRLVAMVLEAEQAEAGS